MPDRSRSISIDLIRQLTNAAVQTSVNQIKPRTITSPIEDWGMGIKIFRPKATIKVTTTAGATSSKYQLCRSSIGRLAFATGGPAHYEGKEMKSAHAGMSVSNPEFDAVLGDLKASLDRLQIPNKEQKELLSIIESTRPQIVTQR